MRQFPLSSKESFTPKFPHRHNWQVPPGAVTARPQTLDTVPAMLRPGEGVLVPEATQAMGGRQGINAINRAAESHFPIKRQHFWQGGIVNTPMLQGPPDFQGGMNTVPDPRAVTMPPRPFVPTSPYPVGTGGGGTPGIMPPDRAPMDVDPYRTSLQHFAGGGVADPESYMTPPPYQGPPPGYFYDNNGNLVSVDSTGRSGPPAAGNQQYADPNFEPGLLNQNVQDFINSSPGRRSAADNNLFDGSTTATNPGNPRGNNGFRVKLDNFRFRTGNGGQSDMRFPGFRMSGNPDLGNMERGNRPGFTDIDSGVPGGSTNDVADALANADYFNRTGRSMDTVGDPVSGNGIPNSTGIGSPENPSFVGGSVFGNTSRSPSGYDAQGNPVYGGQAGGFNIPGGIGLSGLGQGSGGELPMFARIALAGLRRGDPSLGFGANSAIGQYAAHLGHQNAPSFATVAPYMRSTQGGPFIGGGGAKFGPNGRQMNAV